MGEFFEPMHLLILGIVAMIVLAPYWLIFKKAGFSPWLALLILVPLVNVIVLYIVAFSAWSVVPVPPQGWPMQPPNPPSYPPQE
jgi:hypothetical protein